MRHEGVSFYGPRWSDEEGDTDLIYNFFASLIDALILCTWELCIICQRHNNSKFIFILIFQSFIAAPLLKNVSKNVQHPCNTKKTKIDITYWKENYVQNNICQLGVSKV